MTHPITRRRALSWAAAERAFDGLAIVLVGLAVVWFAVEWLTALGRSLTPAG